MISSETVLRVNDSMKDMVSPEHKHMRLSSCVRVVLTFSGKLYFFFVNTRDPSDLKVLQIPPSKLGHSKVSCLTESLPLQSRQSGYRFLVGCEDGSIYAYLEKRVGR